ncbi:MAG: PQQ-binding-like beta-propeller repeat protein [Lacipirellulaceae bacterium]
MLKLPILTALCFAVSFPAALAVDWQQWRGPNGDNHAAAGATAPVEWSEASGLAWNTPLPGRGHSSPTIVGNRIYLTTAHKAAQTQSLLILDRETGRLVKEQIVHRGGLIEEKNLHPNNTHASPTVASDGQRVFTLFLNQDAAWLTAFDLEGEQLWQERAIGFDPQQYKFGFGSSPVVVGDKVIVTSEYDGNESGIVALNTANGQREWKAKRPQKLSYSSVARAKINGRIQLLISGNYQLASYDPNTGEENWSKSGTTQATCGTMAYDPESQLAFASGGYPEVFTLAVETGGQHNIVWKNQAKSYEQSMLVVDGFLYTITDRGIAYCWGCRSGKQMWKQRLGGGFSSSPLLVDGKIYATSEAGTTFVFAANPERFQALGENQLGDEAFATPTPLDGRLYHRYSKATAGGRQEFLAAIGQ